MTFLTDINLSQNQLLNVVLQPLTAHPGNPKVGQIYYNTIEKAIYSFDGTNWNKQAAADSSDTPADLSNYYTKLEAEERFTTSDEVNDLIAAAQMASLSVLVVSDLPETGTINTFYLIANNSSEVNNYYDEYVWVNGHYELIGNTKIDLKDYVTKEELASVGQVVVSKLTLQAGVKYITSQQYSGKFISLAAYDAVTHEALMVGSTIAENEVSFSIKITINSAYEHNIDIFISYVG